MDVQFSSKLTKTLMEVGTKNGLAPPTTQDPADAAMHEFYVAEVGRSLYDKRKKNALDKLRGIIGENRITDRVERARKGEVGTQMMLDAAHYSMTLQTKSPTETLDKTALRVELVKLGVDEVTIEKAFKAATKENKPSETYAVLVKTGD